MKRIALLVLLLVVACLADSASAQFQPPMLLKPGDSLLNEEVSMQQIKESYGMFGEVVGVERLPSTDSLFLKQYNAPAVQEKITNIDTTKFVYAPEQSALTKIALVRTGTSDTVQLRQFVAMFLSTDSLLPGMATVVSGSTPMSEVDLPVMVAYQYEKDPGDPSFMKMDYGNNLVMWVKVEIPGAPPMPTDMSGFTNTETPQE